MPVADMFDQPDDSPDHRVLVESMWLAGDYVVVRYYLGKLLEQNLFRESETLATEKLAQFVAREYSPEAAELFQDVNSWQLLTGVLRSRWERPGLKPAVAVRAVEAFLRYPHHSDQELAERAGTSTKQFQRYTSFGRALQRRLRRGNDYSR